ncbi:hypothetical protein GCM10009837_68900 [Streptomyces durmitorensis]
MRGGHAQRAQPLFLECLHRQFRAAQGPGHPVKCAEPDRLLVIAYHSPRIRHFISIKRLTAS